MLSWETAGSLCVCIWTLLDFLGNQWSCPRLMSSPRRHQRVVTLLHPHLYIHSARLEEDAASGVGGCPRAPPGLWATGFCREKHLRTEWSGWCHLGAPGFCVLMCRQILEPDRIVCENVGLRVKAPNPHLFCFHSSFPFFSKGQNMTLESGGPKFKSLFFSE